MQLRNIAWSSMRRRPGRGAFTAGVVALAAAMVVTLLLLSEAMQTEIGDELDRFGANIVITPKSQSLDLAYGGIALAGLTVDVQQLRTEDAAAVLAIPNRRNINAVAPRLIGSIDVGEHRVLLIGVRHRDEARVRSWWQIEGDRPAGDGDVLVGSEAARALQLAPGDSLTLDGRKLRVSGRLHSTGTLDDAAIIADLAVVQRVLGRPEGVNVIEVSALCSECPIEHMVNEIALALPHARVAPIRQAVAARERAVDQFTRFAYALSALVLVVVMLVVSSTTLASVVERTQEIGILRAVGYRKAQVSRVILMESVWVTAAGGLVGWLAGLGVAALLLPRVTEQATIGSPDPMVGVWAIAGGVLLGAVAGAYPARRATRMEPSQALRHL